MTDPSGGEKPQKPLRPLNERQRKFAVEYAQNGNATQAAKTAGYSPDRAGVTGHDLKTRPEVQSEIQRCMAKHKLSTDRFIGDLSHALDETKESGDWSNHEKFWARGMRLLGHGKQIDGGGDGGMGGNVQVAVIFGALEQAAAQRGL